MKKDLPVWASMELQCGFEYPLSLIVIPDVERKVDEDGITTYYFDEKEIKEIVAKNYTKKAAKVQVNNIVLDKTNLKDYKISKAEMERQFWMEYKKIKAHPSRINILVASDKCKKDIKKGKHKLMDKNQKSVCGKKIPGIG